MDRLNLTGKDFEFLIAGDLDVFDDNFDSIMTPSSCDWVKVERDNWIYYKVGDDEFSYSVEPTGIQMTFNKNMPFPKAKLIADEVIEKIVKAGFDAQLLILDISKIYKF